MQAIISTIGTTGDVLPAIAVARLLAGRGHDVRLLANPAFAHLAAVAGLPLDPVGDAEHLRALFGSDALWDKRTALRVFARCEMLPAMRPMACAVRSAARSAPSFVVAFTFALGAVTAALEPGLPAVRVGLAPAAIARDGSIARCIEMATHLAGYPGRTPGIAVADLLPAIGLFPAWFDGAAQPRQGRIATGFPLDGESGDLPPSLREFLAAGPPPVVAFVGTDRTRSGARMATIAIAIRRCRLRALLITRDPTLSACSGSEQLRVDTAPFGRLFPHIAAVVHHGGIGTIARCLAAGVPQLVVGGSFDGSENAAVLARLGVGRIVAGEAADPEALARDLNELLASPRIRASCDTWQRRIDVDNPFPSTGDAIERIVSRHDRLGASVFLTGAAEGGFAGGRQVSFRL